uniref:Uncharacterized protein n=1 Tax=Pleurozia purpurea TaxID=280637 RepID=D0R048_9MARC|nr:hypothetical protein PlpuMp49 [Pleurozia purpurea]ACR19385.1 hypothetical protein PlpuMp49 [Pleurozia purpurea]
MAARTKLQSRPCRVVLNTLVSCSIDTSKSDQLILPFSLFGPRTYPVIVGPWSKPGRSQTKPGIFMTSVELLYILGRSLSGFRMSAFTLRFSQLATFFQTTPSPRPAYSVRAVVRGAYKPLIKHQIIGKIQVGLRMENSAVAFTQFKFIRKESRELRNLASHFLTGMGVIKKENKKPTEAICQ